MTFKEWKRWYRDMPRCMKWFVILVLIRPLIDIFYDLKTISPLLSPLMLTGALTPILVFISFTSKSMRRSGRVLQDRLFFAFSMATLLNVVTIMVQGLSFNAISTCAKVTIGPIVYFYTRRFVRSRTDIIGLATTFLYSSAVPFAMIAYENFVGQMTPGQEARGMMRIEGLFADVLSYSTYVIFAFIISAFLYLDAEGTKRANRALAVMTLAFSASTLTMISIKHASSWAVFGMITIILVVLSVDHRSLAKAFAPVLAISIAALYFGDKVEEDLSRLFLMEQRILAGEAHWDRGFHGRGTLWVRYFAYWEDSPIAAKLFGTGLNPTSHTFEQCDAQATAVNMISGGMHSDYVRIFLGTGIIGFVAYFGFMLVTFIKGFTLRSADRFLVIAFTSAMLMYSISTTPSLYASATYIPLAVFAYTALLSENAVLHGIRGLITR